jgi:hypothetical protein
MGSPHSRHFPRSHSQENTGTLSYQWMGVWHLGQRDPGNTIENFSGIRTMQTFRKLPMMLPSKNIKTMTTPRMCHTRPSASTAAAAPVPDA